MRQKWIRPTTHSDERDVHVITDSYSGAFEEDMANVGAQLGKAITKSRITSVVMADVGSVDEEARTIDAIVDVDQVFSDISLDIFTNGGNSIYLIPAVGSLVVLGFIEGFTEMPVLLKTTKVDKIVVSNEQQDDSYIQILNDSIEVKRGSSVWRIENGKISLSSDLTEINGGGNDGMVLINELTSSLNNFVSQVGNMVSVFNAHVHTSAAPGSPTSTTVTPMTNPSQFNKSDYENTKVTQ